MQPLVADGLLSLLVEEVSELHIHSDLNVVGNRTLSGGRHADDGLNTVHGDVQVHIGTQQLVEVHNGIQCIVGSDLLEGQEVLRTDTHDHGLAHIGSQGGDLSLGNQQGVAANLGVQLAVLIGDSGIDEVHLGAADEACYEQVAGRIVQGLGGVKLLDDAVLHNDDPVAHGHSLGLVVGDVDKGGVQLPVQTGDLSTHGGTQLGVQVGKRLVQQEDGRIPDHCTAQSHTLTLTTGQCLGLTVQQMLQIQDLGSFVNTLVDLVLVHLTQGQAESDVLVNVHVGVQSVVLEDHGDVAVLGG